MCYQKPHLLIPINISCRGHGAYLLRVVYITYSKNKALVRITIRILYSFLEVQDAPKNLNFILIFFRLLLTEDAYTVHQSLKIDSYLELRRNTAEIKFFFSFFILHTVWRIRHKRKNAADLKIQFIFYFFINNLFSLKSMNRE